jgi:outer membrane lipase/esterase
MNAKKRLLPALLVSLFALPAGAAQFSNVVVFGDSLSDAGYFRPFLAGLGIPAQEVSVLGRFTTNPGPVWSELVTTFYGHTPAASNAGGLIFAQGGARVATASASTPPGAAQRPVSTQINEYLSANGGAADPNALYGVWIGANDIFQNLAAFSAGAIDQTALQNNVLGAATAEIQQIGRLRGAGARYILVFGLPNIGATPAFAGSASTSAAVTQLSAGYNTTLWSGLASAGIRAIPVDSFSLLNEVGANPSAYGFTNVTGLACGPFPPFTTATSISAQFCDANHLAAPNADQTYLFADSVHPTTAAQKIIAQFAEALIEGPTQYSLLAETPLRTRANQVRTINDGALQGRDAPIGKFTVFAAGNGSKFDINSSTGNTGVNNDLSSIGVGVLVRPSEALTLGLAYGQDRANGTFGMNAGDFRTRENAYTLFGKVNWKGFYGSGIFTVSNIDFKDMHRNITLGPLVRTADASTDGSNGSAFFDAGYDFTFGRFAVGPVVAVAMQNVTVNAFDEGGAGSANLHIAQQTRKSEVWSFGLHAACTMMDHWTPWVRVTADHENKNDDRFVTAMPISLTATANSYDIAAYKPDSSFVTSAIGVNGIIAERIGVSIAYFNVSGRSGIKEDGVYGTLSYRF